MGNFTRNTFNKLKHYVGIRLQQGVPILDADWNEMEDIRKHELQTFLKWFVGNGVPQGNDGFRIIGSGLENDFTIKGGTEDQPGRCLVEGWDVMIEGDIRYAEQPLYDNDPLVQEWGVEPLGVLSPPAEGEGDRKDLVYLDVWEREVGALEDKDLVLVIEDMKLETCVRLKREWVVRVAEGVKELPAPPGGHVYYEIAQITRKANVNTISEHDITDVRQTCLSLPGIKEYIDFKSMAAQVGAITGINNVENPGGSIELVGDNAIDIIPGEELPKIKISDSHSPRTDNPHQTTAGQVGALVSVGGVRNPGGDVYLRQDESITITPDDEANAITISETHSSRTDNPHGTTAEQVGALPIAGGNLLDNLTVNGKVGIGTTNPQKNVHIQGESDAPLKNDTHDRPGLAITGHYPQLDLFSSANNTTHGPTIRIGSYNDDSKINFKHWNIGTSGRNSNFLDFGFYSGTNANPHYGIRNIKGRTVLTLKENGNVGIGTLEPGEKLEVNGTVKISNVGHFGFYDGKPTITSETFGSLRLKAVAGDAPQLVVATNGNIGIGTTNPVAMLDVRGPIYAGNSDFHFTKTDHNYTGIGSTPGYASIENSSNHNSLMILGRSGTSKGRYVRLWDYLQVNGSMDVTGHVGIGTPEPGAKLEVVADSQTWNGWYEAIRLGQSAHSAITHPGSGLMFGFHNNRNFYFVDTVQSQPIMWIDANPIGGNVVANHFSGSFNDYAEYFESKDGKEINAGISVSLNNGKIRPAKKEETPVGIISANPGIVGGVHIEWPKKHLRDEFGRVIMEEYKEEIMVPKKEKVKKERQKMEKKKVKEKVKRTEVVKKKGKYYQVEVEETVERDIEEPVFKELDLYDDVSKKKVGKHKIPVMETYEEEIDVLDDRGQPVMVGSGKFETKTRPKINPDYDEKKEYIPREKRPEWNCVGLLGQLPLRKGQPVAPTWIKIKDISKDVELWLVK